MKLYSGSIGKILIRLTPNDRILLVAYTCYFEYMGYSYDMVNLVKYLLLKNVIKYIKQMMINQSIF